MKLSIKPEVLSPVGDMERLISAIEYGADAVYLAGKMFGMRAAPSNFSEEELEVAVKVAHEKNVKVYVTCNTVPHVDEMKFLPAYLEKLNEIGVDAVIVSDLGVLSLAKKYAPSVEIHISTQAGVTNAHAANVLYEMGAKRVVLAREVSISEIAEIRKNIPSDMDIEVFVHGAMCMSFSGRCLISHYLNGRDANRGACSQPCRWEYVVTEKQRPNQQFAIKEDERGTFLFNSKDMCMIEHIPQLVAAGVTSLKIEGRAKSAYYVASVTSAYRRAVDFIIENPMQNLPQSIIDETEKISHREYSTGFYLGTEPGQSLESGGYIREYDVVAVCEGSENGFIKLKQRNKFLKGEIADVLEPNSEPFLIKLDEIYDEWGNEIESAPHAEMTVLLKSDLKVKKGAFLRVKRN